MQTTSGLFTYLSHRFGAVDLTLLIVLAVAVAAAAGFTFLVVSELLAAAADPVQVAPVRWMRRA